MSGHVRRSRDGCWTCRRRKKKCDGKRPACQNCENLRVQCEGYSQRILWEDSEPRIGMRRRGPVKRTSQIYRPGSNTTRMDVGNAASEAEEQSSGDKANSSSMLSSTGAGNASSGHDALFENSSTFSMDGFNNHRTPTPEVGVEDLLPSSPFRFLSPHPLGLTPLQSLFLDHYLNNFSLKYPTYLDPSNPFLSTLVPLALRSTTVLCAVLAIGGIQTGLESRADVMAEILALKGRTLRGCRKLLQRSGASIYLDNGPVDGHLPSSPEPHSAFIVQSSKERLQGECEEDDLMLFASVMMLMVHDKLSGEPCSKLRPHLQFAHHFERRPIFHQVSVHYKFLRNIFLYNDLLAAISSGSPSLQDYGQNTTDSVSVCLRDSVVPLKEEGSSMVKLAGNRYYLPILLSRIANGSNKVALTDIERWDGNMTWLPSFSSTEITEVISTIENQPSSTPIADESENVLISEIYRNATRVLYYQRLRNKSELLFHPPPICRNVPSYEFEIQHFNSILLVNLRSLPLGSAYESSLLFPIGIAAMEIRDVCEKAYVLSRLQLLEERFQLNHFRKFRQKLSAFWEGEDQVIRQQFACDAILLG